MRFVLRNIAVSVCLFSGVLLSAFAEEQNAAPINKGDILSYLEQVIGWRHAYSDAEPMLDSPREAPLKERLRQYSKNILKSSFVFARQQAEIIELPASSPEPQNAAAASTLSGRHGRLVKAAADVKLHAADLQDRLSKGNLSADEHEKISENLKLVNAQQALLATMLNIFSAEGDKSGGLLDQINAIYRSVSGEIQDAPAAKEDSGMKVSAPKETPPDNGGMLGLSESLISLSRKRNAIEGLKEQTSTLTAVNEHLIDATRTALRAALAEGNALTSEQPDDKSKTPTSEHPADKSKASPKASMDLLILRYKQLGDVIAPLGEISVLLEKSSQNLNECARLLQTDWRGVFHQLMIRLAILAVSIIIPFVASEIARRASVRYVSDAKRRNQLRLLRRALLAAALAFVILANFLTEFGSLATFAGFITAGLAVALQTVLISFVAHFMYLGRYGVRNGDRVTVAGVTGEVVQVGIMRLYLRELKEAETGWVPTGKIVAFPNSILFQPTAFYKHVSN